MCLKWLTYIKIRGQGRHAYTHTYMFEEMVGITCVFEKMVEVRTDSRKMVDLHCVRYDYILHRMVYCTYSSLSREQLVYRVNHVFSRVYGKLY